MEIGLNRGGVRRMLRYTANHMVVAHTGAHRERTLKKLRGIFGRF
jgi:hypothetical protein